MFLIKLLLFVVVFFNFAFSKGEVSTIYAHYEDASKTNYEVNGTTYQWGEGNNLIIDGFEYNKHRYNYVSESPIIKIRRSDNNNSSGEPCGLFAEKKDKNQSKLAPTFPEDCDMAKVMGGRIINIGALDLFKNANDNYHTAKNIERVDFISTDGIIAPSNADDLTKAGHVVTEKSGNNEIKIAAILSLDANGNPASFGSLVTVHDQNEDENNDSKKVDYGDTYIHLNSGEKIGAQTLGFYRNENYNPQTPKPTHIGDSTEKLDMAFVTLQDLGIKKGEKYYGFSYFGSDVYDTTDLVDYTSFPKNTPMDSLKHTDTADPYGGVASYFEDEDIIPKIVAEYRFDKCSWNGTAGEVKDQSQHQHDAQARNSTNTSDNQTIMNRSAKFERNNKQYLEAEGFDNVLGTTSDAFAITAWIYPTSLSDKNETTNHGTENTFMAKASDSKNDNFEIGVNPNGTIHLYLDTQSKDTQTDLGAKGDVSINKWHFIALSYEDGTVTLQIDDKSYINSTTWSGATVIDDATGSPLTLGASIHKDNFFDGYMDEVKIFKTPLKAQSRSHIRTREMNHQNWNDGTSRELIGECMLPINCLPTALMFQNKPSDINILNLMTGEMNELQNHILENNINAVGYNTKDGYFWGSDYTSKNGTLVQIGQDYLGNTVAKNFQIKDYNGSSYVGDIDNNGHLYLKSGNRIDVVDLNPSSTTYLTKIRNFNLINNIGIADWAFDPNDNFLYAINNGSGTKYLYKIDPSNGSIISKIDTNITNNRSFGASFFDADGFLYSYDNKTGEIFRTDVKNNAHTVLFSRGGTKVSLNDGAMCTDITLKFDFGDLPNSYGTTLNQNGARHALPSSTPSSLYMGNTVTQENEGKPSDDAYLDGGDDGVEINNSSLQDATIDAGHEATFKVTVAGNGYLNAWIDWNADGDFNDTNEQIATNISNVGNIITFTILVPNNKTRTTYARFRYSSQSDLNATGYAINGEVEDYKINIKGNLQPFTCDDTLYLSNRSKLGTGNNDSGETWLHTINQGSPYTYTTLGEGFTSDNGGYNALGYNVQDNFMYALYGNVLVKIDKDAKVQEMGAISGLPEQQLYAGEFDRDGFFYATGKGGADKKMYKIDIAQNKVIETITLSQSVRFWDMAVDKSGDYFYVMLIGDGDTDSKFNNDKLAKINKKTGEITTIGDSHAKLSSYISLVFSDKDGQLFMMSNENGFYSVNTETGALYPLASTKDLTFYNDGTSCPNAHISNFPKLTVNNVKKKEGDSGFTNFNFTLKFSKATTLESGFWFRVTDGVQAILPNEIAEQTPGDNDYIGESGYIAIPINTKELNITVQVVGDQKMERNEEFYLDLYSPNNIILQDSHIVGTIINDDRVLFNVERTNSDTVDNATQQQKESLYTQIVGRDFNYAVVVYDKNQTINAEATIKGITLKVELFDYNSSVTDNLRYSSYLYFPASELKPRLKVTDENDLKIAQATRDAGFKISYLIDENDSIVYGQYNNKTAYNTNKKSYREETLNARDNFAIRPASYRVSIDENATQLLQNNQENSINLAAEHDYNLSAYATAYQSEDVAQNYTLQKSKDLNVSLIFKDKEKLICDDEEDKNQNNSESMKYLFSNGRLNHTFSLNNVGNYTLHIQDVNWTKIDQNKNSNLAGCIANSAIVSNNSDEKSGCNIVSNLNEKMANYTPKHYDINIAFKPYAFDLSNISLSNLPKTTHNYVYMNDLHDNAGMGILINGDIIAKGEKGTILTNFTTGCVAEDVQISVDYNITTTQGTFSKNGLVTTNPKTNITHDKSYINPLDFLKKFFSLKDVNLKTTRNSQVQSSLIIGYNGKENNATYQKLYEPIPLKKEYFLYENKGSSNLTILYNIAKNYKETINPIKIDFISIDANATTSNSIVNNQDWFPIGQQKLNQTRYFYFTRLAPDLENYHTVYKRSLATPVTIEIYCEHNRSWCTEMVADNGRNNANTQIGWYTAQHHNIPTDGTIHGFEIDKKNVSVTDINNSFYRNGRFNKIKTSYSGDKKSVVTQINMDATRWLNYHPKAQDGIPYWKIKFKKMAPSNPSGIGQTGHQLELDRHSTVPANRLGW